MTDADRIPTNLRTLLILEILGKSDQAMTATQINDHLGLPKQTVHRLCVTLEENGFLTRSGHSKKFQVEEGKHSSREMRRQCTLSVRFAVVWCVENPYSSVS